MKINKIALAVLTSAIAPLAATAGVTVSPLLLGYHHTNEANVKQREKFITGNIAVASANPVPAAPGSPVQPLNGVALDGGLYTGVALGVELSPSSQFQVEYGVSNANARSTDADWNNNPNKRFDGQQRDISGNFLIGGGEPGSKFKPYVLIGGGQSVIKVKNQAQYTATSATQSGIANNASVNPNTVVVNYKSPIVNAGLGARYLVNDALALRGEARAVHNTKGRWWEALALAGVEVTLGGRLSPTVVVPPRAEPVPAPVAPVERVVEVVEVVEVAPQPEPEPVPELSVAPVIVPVVQPEPEVIIIEQQPVAPVVVEEEPVVIEEEPVVVEEEPVVIEEEPVVVEEEPVVVEEEPVVVVTPPQVIIEEPVVVDSDGDGVPDHMDACAGTPSNFVVDARGCPIEDVVEDELRLELRVFFDNDKSIIKPQYRAEVAQVAEKMREYPNAIATIEGHASKTGPSASYNKRLSEARANAVKSMLINEFGIDPERVTAIGYGYDQPIAPNNTEEGRALNRRVEAMIEGSKPKVVNRTYN